MLDREWPIDVEGGSATMNRELFDRVKEAVENAPRCEVCKVEPVAATLTVRRMTGEMVKQLDVCHECLIKEM